ncbi:MAG: hypothetical protein SFW67_12865 [Myxococcaceae bacterium]|nr:hypothetical protein [Myxococcaceae bacterium]
MHVVLVTMYSLTARVVRGSDACEVSAALVTERSRCDEGLVCNVPLLRCERPNQGAPGARCGSDGVCRVELWCPPGLDAGCTARLGEGEACPAGVGCEAGLRCEKGDAAWCVFGEASV